MYRTKTYGAILLLICFCIISAPRVLSHHCDDLSAESSHAHAGDVKFEHPECPWCDFEIPLDYEDNVHFDLSIQIFASDLDVVLVTPPTGPDHRKLDPRGPPLG